MLWSPTTILSHVSHVTFRKLLQLALTLHYRYTAVYVFAFAWDTLAPPSYKHSLATQTKSTPRNIAKEKEWLLAELLAVLRFPREVKLLPSTTLFKNRMKKLNLRLFVMILFVEHVAAVYQSP